MVGFQQHPDGRAGYQFGQELQPFRRQVARGDVDPGDIALRAVVVLDDAERNQRRGDAGPDDRDRRGRAHYRSYSVGRATGRDYLDLVMDEVGGQLRETSEIASGVAVLDQEVAALGVAGPREPRRSSDRSDSRRSGLSWELVKMPLKRPCRRARAPAELGGEQPFMICPA